jgi:cell division protein FtsL
MNYKLLDWKKWEPETEALYTLSGYMVLLVPLDMVFLRKDMYPLNYAIINLETERIEGLTPSFPGAKQAIMNLAASDERLELMEHVSKVGIQVHDDDPTVN